MRDSVVRLRELGFDREVIVDAGAYEGRWLRMATEVFPSVRILSFEAQPAMEPAPGGGRRHTLNKVLTDGRGGILRQVDLFSVPRASAGRKKEARLR